MEHIGINGIRRSGKSYVFGLLSRSGVSRSSIVEQVGSPTPNGVHVVRHPLDTIASLRTLSEAEWQNISEVVEQVKMTDSVLRRSMMLYYHGNRAAGSVSRHRIQVENITPATMRRVFDVDSDCDFSEVPTDSWKVTVWADLKREDIRAAIAVADLSRRYGYDSPIIETNKTCAGCI